MADRSGYIGRAPGDSSVIVARKVYEPTGVQTDFTFTAGYTPGYCDAYINGVKLINSTDYTASDGSTVGLTSAAQSGDVVEIVAYKAFNLGMPISDVTGNLDVTGNISASSSITADGAFYGDGSNLTNIAGVGITQYIDANSLTVIGSPGVSTITRLGVTDAVVTGIITANGLSGNVVGAAATFTTGTFNGNVTIGGTLTYEDVTNVDALGIVTARAGVAVTGGQLTVGAAYSVGHAGVVTAQNVTISAGTIDLKNSGSVSNIKFYCESANAHYTALQSAAHSAYSGNVTLTLPVTTDTLIGRTTTDTLTNKTLTSPTLTTPVFSGAATGELKVGSGITMAATSGVVTFADGSTTTNALHFGSGGDLKVYHNGSNSFIQDTGTGSLFIDGTVVYLRNPAGDEHLANFHSDGAANLYYNGSVTFSTTDDGTTTTGIATATGLDVADKITHTGDPNTAIRFPANDNITFETNGSERLRISAGLAGTCLLLAGDRVDSTSKTLHLTLNHYSFNTVNQIDVIGGTTGSGYNRVHIGGNDVTSGNTAATEIKFYTGANATTTNGSERLSINSGGDVNFSGTAAGVASAFWDASANSLIFKDNSYAKFGDSSDLKIYHDASHSYITDSGTGQLRIQSDAFSVENAAGNENIIGASENGGVSLYYDNSSKLTTVHEGILVSGMCSVTTGIAVTGGMLEGVRLVAGKLSDNTNIDLADANIWYFSTQESTTSTPNLRWDSSTSLAAKVIRGEAITVTIITTAAAGGYSANLNIDGGGQTEEWNGGSAPSAGGSGGYDVYTHTIYRKVDGNWLVLSNVSNFA